MDHPANGSGIGAPVRRREDLRLVRGAGRYTADENLPGQAYAVMVRSPHAHARMRAHRHRRGQGRARRARGAHRRRCSRRRPKAHSAQAVVAASGGSHACATRAASRRSRRRIIRCRPTKRASSARRWRWWSPRPCMRPRTAPRRSRSITTCCRPWSRPPPRRGRMRRIVHEPARSNVCFDSELGDAAATDAAFARAAHVTRFETWVQRVTGVPMEPRGALADIRRRDRSLHGLCRQRRRRPPEKRSRHHARR